MSAIADGRPAAAIGGRVARARRDRGMTQRDLADVLGVPAWTVDRIEAGAADVTPFLPVIADSHAETARVVLARGRAWSSHRLRRRGRYRPGQARSPADSCSGRSRSSSRSGSSPRSFPSYPERRTSSIFRSSSPSSTAAALLTRAAPVRRPGYLSLGLPAAVFLMLAIVSAVVNGSRTAPAPVVVFIYGFLGPVAVFAVVYRLWPPGNAPCALQAPRRSRAGPARGRRAHRPAALPCVRSRPRRDQRHLRNERLPARVLPARLRDASGGNLHRGAQPTCRPVRASCFCWRSSERFCSRSTERCSSQPSSRSWSLA